MFDALDFVGASPDNSAWRYLAGIFGTAVSFKIPEWYGNTHQINSLILSKLHKEGSIYNGFLKCPLDDDFKNGVSQKVTRHLCHEVQFALGQMEKELLMRQREPP
jgi:hypothetical protein